MAVAAIAARLETEENAMTLPFLLPSLPGNPVTGLARVRQDGGDGLLASRQADV